MVCFDYVYVGISQGQPSREQLFLEGPIRLCIQLQIRSLPMHVKMQLGGTFLARWCRKRTGIGRFCEPPWRTAYLVGATVSYQTTFSIRNARWLSVKLIDICFSNIAAGSSHQSARLTISLPGKLKQSNRQTGFRPLCRSKSFQRVRRSVS